MKNSDLLTKFKNAISELINPNSAKILVAVSGGVDSVSLVYLLKKINVNFSIAHCNFNLRGMESGEDEKFVQSIANELNVSFYSITFETKKIQKDLKLSLQETARKLRYDWFEQLKKEQNFDYIATAHHLNDSVETIFLNLTHGCGIRGLHGIPEKNQNRNIIRPLLSFSKNEILEFALQENLKFREDSSNESLKYERNKIRKQIIPVLEDLNPGLNKTFKNNIIIFKEIEILYQTAIKTFLAKISEKDEDNILKISIPKLKASGTAHSLLYEAINSYGFNQKQIFQIIEHLDKQSGAIYFSEHFKLTKSYNFLILEKKEQENYTEKIKILLSDPIEHSTMVIFENIKFDFIVYPIKNLEFNNPEVAFLDADKLSYPISIRNPLLGDVFYPFGMSGKMKLLSKFFKDEKINLSERKSVNLICSGNDIVWIAGIRTDDRFKIDGQTKRILEIRMTKNV